MTKQQTVEPLCERDTRVVLDEIYYTISGAMKVLGVGKNTIVNSIKKGTLQVFRHPSGNLFSKESLGAWIKERTSKTGKAKK